MGTKTVISAMLIVAGALSACVASTDDTNGAIEYLWLTEADIADGNALIDLQRAAVYHVAPLDYALVDVLCPNGRFMRMDQWLAENDVSPDGAVLMITPAGLFPTLTDDSDDPDVRGSRQAVAPLCTSCSDGATICRCPIGDEACISSALEK